MHEKEAHKCPIEQDVNQPPEEILLEYPPLQDYIEEEYLD